jgi:hypothetical protein
MNLLVIDYDYFFPECDIRHSDPDKQKLWMLYDWGHSETNMLTHSLLWPTRAATFKSYGLPLPGLTGEQDVFWPRFTFTKQAKLYYADSNVMAVADEVKRGVAGQKSQVWLYDAHHDSGYNTDLAEIFKRQYWTCEDWMIQYACSGCMLHVRYPKWKTWAFKAEPEPETLKTLGVKLDRQFDDITKTFLETPTFHKVFVCRSGAWVPSWLDGDFEKFIAACPLKAKRDIGKGNTAPRVLDYASIEREAEQQREMREKFRQEREQQQARAVNPQSSTQ